MESDSGSATRQIRARLRRLRAWLPTGRTLDDAAWRKRHQGIRILLAAHALGLLIFGLIRGFPPEHLLLEAGIPAMCAVASGARRIRRRAVAEGLTTFGLIASSALLVHLSGGMIEAHFHFFVMVIVIALYQDWTPFLLTLLFVVAHHGFMGVLDPQSVYNHSAAWMSPWKWAIIHGIFVLGASATSLVSWRMDEQVRRAQQNSASQLAATLESTADGIIAIDQDGSVAFYNHTFVDIWGVERAILNDPQGEAWVQLILTKVEDPAEFMARVQHLGNTDEDSFDVVRFRDGRVFERYSQVRRVNGKTAGRVWSFRDVTQQIRVDEMKNSFLSAVSHELRTPLSAVLGYASTLRHQGHALDEAMRSQIIDRIQQSAVKLNRLLTDTLDLDRLSRGMIDPLRVDTDVERLVRATVHQCEVIDAGRVAIEVEPIMASLDPAKFERILENLLINCSRHTPEGTPIWVRASATEDGVLLAVEDAGPGVPDAIKAAIFEPFRQGPVPEHSPGVGIGLSLVQRFAALHGGRAWVQDRLGGGTSFRVSIPAETHPRIFIA